MAKTNLRLTRTWQQLNPLTSWPEEKLVEASEDGTGKEKRIQLIIIANIHCSLSTCPMLCMYDLHVLAHLFLWRLQRDTHLLLTIFLGYKVGHRG